MLRSLFRRSKLDDDMDAELRFHVEEQTRANLAGGMLPDEAALAARRQLGWRERIREEAREARGGAWPQDFFREYRQSARSLARSPAFTLSAVAILTLSIASVALVRLFYDEILFATQPHVQHIEQLVRIFHKPDGSSTFSRTASLPEYQHWRDTARSFSEVAAFSRFPSPGELDGSFDLFEARRVSENFFRTVGVEPAKGRAFTEADCNSGAAAVVIISDRLWQTRFGADPKILGRTFSLGIGPLSLVLHTIVGVMPARFSFPDGADFWLPLVETEPTAARPSSSSLWVIARLADGVSSATAQAEMTVLVSHEASADESDRVMLYPEHDIFSGQYERYLQLFLWAVIAIQILACANIAGLMFSRGVQRLDQTALRAALGASRWRLMREMLLEGLLLAIVGLGFGLALATFCKPAAVRLLAITGSRPAWWTFSFDARTIGYTATMAVVTVLGFSLLPAWLYSNPMLAGRLQTTGAARRPPRAGWLGAAAVSAQIMVAGLLLVGAALAVADVQAFRRTNLGIDPRGVAYIIPGPINLKPEQAAGYYERVMREIKLCPGVEAVGAADTVPGISGIKQALIVEAPTAQGGKVETSSDAAYVRSLTPGMLDVLQIRLLRGRNFAESEMASAAPVVLIDRVLATRLFGDEDPIGRRIASAPDAGGEPRWETIVGVVGATRANMYDRDPIGAVFRPMHSWFSTGVFVRRNGPWLDTARMIVAAARRIEPRTVIFPAPVGASLTARLDEQFWQVRLLSEVMTVFAVLGFSIAAVGTYGLVAFAVTSRTQEIGVRLALGATRGRVVREIAGRIARAVLCGLSASATVAFLVAPKLQPLIRKVDPRDPLVHLAALGFLSIVAALACWLPARRAAKVDPMIALRAE